MKLNGMLPMWLVTALPTWLVVFIILYALAALYVAIKFKEVRKFLAGAFFVSSGILWYLWITGTSLPIVLPYAGTISVETPDISGQRAIVHFILFLLCFYFGFISNTNPLFKQLVRSSVLGTIVMLALIFIPAVTVNYWQGWAYAVTFIICCAAYTVYLAKYDPALLKRRTEAGIPHEKEFTQKVVLALLFTACIVLVVLPPLDFRFGWSLMAWQASIIGNALVAFFFLYFLSRIKSEHLCRRQYPGRRGAKSDLDRHVRLHPSSNVLRRPISIHRNAICARIMVGYFCFPCFYRYSLLVF